MPAGRRSEWEALLEIEEQRKRSIKIEAYLDAGHGECILRHPEIACLVQENLLRFDGSRYRLLAWVVMPNHVHALIEMLETSMSSIVKAWKSYTGKKINRLLRRNGQFWQAEYFDRFMRDEDHCRKAVRYIENNPVKARLTKTAEEWAFGSARFRSAWGSPARP
jgi:putative DNA methylase